MDTRASPTNSNSPIGGDAVSYRRSQRSSAVWSRPLALGALAACLLGPRLAHADPKDDARRHFIAGLEAAKRQEFQAALDEFLLAQSAYPHPATAFNIAKSYTDLQNYTEAIRWYRVYQELAPDKAEGVDETIASLEARLRPAATPAPTPSAAPAAASSATAEELERLVAIADELRALSETLATRPAAAPESTQGGETTTSTGGGDQGSGATTGEPPAIADGGALLLDAYERVVVTASRYGQDPLDSPSTVAVITEQDIRLSGATNVPDLLRRVVGVDVMSLSAAQPELSIRGFNRELSNKVLVLIDGRSVYLDVLGSVVWSHLPIGLGEIERIEIIRGPGSAVYGANAVTGVINIITRTPGDGLNSVHVEGGRPGYAQGNAIVTGRRDRTTWRASAGYQRTGRWSQEDDVANSETLEPFQEDQSLSMSVLRANGRVDQTFADKGFFSISGGYATGLTEFYTLGALGDYMFDLNNGYARADLSYGKFHLRTFYNTVNGSDGPWAQQVGARDLDNQLDSRVFDTELETQQDFNTGAVRHRLAAGVGFRYKSVDWDYLIGEANPEGVYTEPHFSAFAQDEARISRVNLVGSLRVDRHPLVDIKETLSPRAAAIVRVADKTSVRVAGGTSFRAPSFLESYLDMELPVSSDAAYLRVYGDPELHPERIATGEIGVHDESTAYHTADLALYVNRVSDLIGLSDSTPVLAPFDEEDGRFLVGTDSFVNLETVYTGYGAELDTRVFPVDGLDLYANLDVQQVRDDTGAIDGSTSMVKANLGALVRTPWRVDLAAHVNYASAQTWPIREFDAAGAIVVEEKDVPSRTILVGRVDVRPFGDERLELALNAWNILALISGDGFIEHPKGQQVSGRLYGSAVWRF